MSQSERKRIFLFIADAVGIGHFVVCNFIVALGFFTRAFGAKSGQLSGLEFVYQTFDAPVYTIAKPLIEWLDAGDLLVKLSIGEFVIVLSSLLYAVLGYLIFKLLFLFFN